MSDWQEQKKDIPREDRADRYSECKAPVAGHTGRTGTSCRNFEPFNMVEEPKMSRNRLTMEKPIW